MRKSFNLTLSQQTADAKNQLRDILNDKFYEVTNDKLKRKKFLNDLIGKKNE